MCHPHCSRKFLSSCSDANLRNLFYRAVSTAFRVPLHRMPRGWFNLHLNRARGGEGSPRLQGTRCFGPNDSAERSMVGRCDGAAKALSAVLTGAHLELKRVL